MINELTAKQMHNVILMLAKEIRDEFEKHDKSYINLTIKVEGRTRDELKLTYELGTGAYGRSVEGGSVDRVLMEVLRREHWQELNASIALPKPCDTANAKDDDKNIFL